MKAVFASALSLAVGLGCPTVSVAAPGDLDPSLAGDGITRVTDPNSANRVAPRADGGFILAGNSGRHARSRAELWAYQSNGEIDTTFGEQGRVELQPQAQASSAGDVVVLPSGDMIASGCLSCTTVSGDPVGFVTRLHSDGSVDRSFGADGVVADPRLDGSGALFVYDDGRILVSTGRIIARLLPSGSPDQGFSDDGFADVTPIVITAVDVQDDGAVVFGGYNTDDPPDLEPIELRRLLPDGRTDSSFGGDGVVDFDVEPAFGNAVDIVVDQDQRLVVGAEGCTPIQLGPGGGGSDCATTLLRFLPNGDPDHSFGPEGRRTETAGAGLVEDPLGRTLVFGTQSPGQGFADTFAVQRLLPDGTVDAGFGLSGTTYAYYRFDAGRLDRAAVSADGDLIGLGTGNEHPYERVLMRFTASGEGTDLDADGVSDQDDRCRLFWGARASGCSTMKRRVFLSHRRPRRQTRLDALIDAPLVACEQRQTAILRRLVPGKDPTVAKGKTDISAGARIHFPGHFAPGRYYAVAPQTRATDIGACARAKSKVIAVPRDTSG